MSKIRHLYIIGNGFDLHHGIPSSYNNYKNWLSLRWLPLYDEIARSFIGADKVAWWSDFENSLAKLDIQYDLSIIQFQDYEVDGIVIEGCNRPTRLDAMFSAIKHTFTVWAKGLNDLFSSVQPDMNLNIDSSALYLTFNYTNTLQDIYQIPDNQIYHIHGNAKTGEELVLGHGETGDFYPKEQFEIVDFKNDPYKIAEQITALKKPTSEIIAKNRNLFNSLSDVENITIYGFSFSSIDMPYIKEIIKHIKPNVKWYIYVRSDGEIERIEKMEELMPFAVKYIYW